MRQVIIKRRVDGPSIPELGAPTALTFSSVSVPIVRPSTGPAAIASYEIQRSTDGTNWTTAATGALIFGNPPTAYVDGGRLASTTYFYRARATDTGGRISDFSAPVNVTTPTVAVSDVPPRDPRPATKWVSPTGEYLGNPAFTTFAAANAAAVPGDVIHVAPGTYTQTALITTSGTASLPITWMAANPNNPPVIDGQYVRPTGWNESGGQQGSAALVAIDASNIVWDQINIRNSRVIGLQLGPSANNGFFLQSGDVNSWRTNIRIYRTEIRGTNSLGVDHLNVDGSTIGGCRIIDTERNAFRADGNQSGWASAMFAMGRNILIVESLIAQSNGEGIHSGHHINFGDGVHIQAENITVRNCVIFDCWSAGLYISNTDGGLFERNLIYKTSDTRYWQFGTSGFPLGCVAFGSESLSFSIGRVGTNGLAGGRNIVFRNNVMSGARSLLGFDGWTGSSYTNVTIENNTFFRTVQAGSSLGETRCLYNELDGGRLSSLTFRNNLIFDSNGRVCNRWDAMGGTNTVSHNLWSHTPPANISGSNQIVTTAAGLTNPTYAITNSYPTVPTFDTNAFRLQPGSPALNAGVAVSGVTTDYFGSPRSAPPDIGAHELT